MSINKKNQDCFSELLDDSFELNEDVSRLSVKSTNVKQYAKNALIFNKGKVKESDEISMKQTMNKTNFEEKKYLGELNMKPCKSDIAHKNKQEVLFATIENFAISNKNQYDYKNGTIIRPKRLLDNKKYSTFKGNLCMINNANQLLTYHLFTENF